MSDSRYESDVLGGNVLPQMSDVGSEFKRLSNIDVFQGITLNSNRKDDETGATVHGPKRLAVLRSWLKRCSGSSSPSLGCAA